MAQKISVKFLPRDRPDLDQFVAALLAMATRRLEEERANRAAKAADREDL